MFSYRSQLSKALLVNSVLCNPFRCWGAASKQRNRRPCSRHRLQPQWTQRVFEDKSLPSGLSSPRVVQNQKQQAADTTDSNGFHTVRNHGGKAAAVPGPVTHSERQQGGCGGRRVQYQPHTGFHLLQHQPGPLPATACPHVSSPKKKSCGHAGHHDRISLQWVSQYSTVSC